MHKCCGHTVVPLSDAAEIFPVANMAIANRKSRGTKMNNAAGSHAGSSRSHCALILTMYKKTSGGGESEWTWGRAGELKRSVSNPLSLIAALRSSTFTLMDLAGAERPSKTNAQDVDQSLAMMNIFASSRNAPLNLPELSVAEQGKMINFERFELEKEVNLASNKHRRRLLCEARTQATTPFIHFVGFLLDGRWARTRSLDVERSTKAAHYQY